jgi:hypothetical protein
MAWPFVGPDIGSSGRAKGAAGRLGEVRHLGNIAKSFEAVVTLTRRFPRQRM